MWRGNAARFFVLALASVLLSPGCATLAVKSTQKIPVTSSPAGAAVIINGIGKGVTPLMIKLDRMLKGPVIRIESPGYNPVEIRVRRKISGETIPGSLLLGLAPGVVPALLLLGSDHARIDPSDEPAILSAYLKSAAVLGVLFVSLDLGGGKGYTLTPENLMVTLTKADGTPEVNTVLLDADDLRNVNWIRVHRY